MKQGRTIILLGALIAAAACTTRTPPLEIRAVNNGSAPRQETAAAQLAQANGHFALGSVALALEGYRRTIRLDPQNVEAMLGMAACYDRMGRSDVGRKYLEDAVALAPSDGRLRGRLAALPPVQLRQQGAPSSATRSNAGEGPKLMATTAVVAEAIAREDVRTSPFDKPKAQLAANPTTAKAALHLQRLNSHEVALVSPSAVSGEAGDLLSSKALRRTQLAAKSVDRREARARLTILNAARIAGLAARVRKSSRAMATYDIVIGDAPKVLERTEIRYAPDRLIEAQRLSKRIGAPIRRAKLPAGSMAIWLGRDAVRLGSI